MSGVNGGLDYEISWNQVPDEFRQPMEYIYKGPDSPAAFVEAMRDITRRLESAGPATALAPDTVMAFLVDSLGYNNPVAARLAQDALVRVYGARAVPTLLRGVAALNYSVNAYALRVLAQLQDAQVTAAVWPVALQCARRGPIPNVRRAAIRCLGSLRYVDRESETADGSDGSDGRTKRREALETLLLLMRDESDWSIRYAAVAAAVALVNRAAASLAAAERAMVSETVQCVARDDTDETVRLRAAHALRQLNGDAEWEWATSSPSPPAPHPQTRPAA